VEINFCSSERVHLNRVAVPHGMFCSEYQATASFVEDTDKLFDSLKRVIMLSQRRNFGALLAITALI
jgi:hypothetical protein